MAWCRKAYQTFIPNGDRIPHPCGDDHVWGGVGHYQPGGGGQRNPFGEDFAANSLVSLALFIVFPFLSFFLFWRKNFYKQK